MMKLYYSKAACSLAPHIVLEELGLAHEMLQLDLRKDIPTDFYKINAMGAVPTLVMEDHEPLTEVAVILQYLADRKPEAKLAFEAGTKERYRLQEWLNFIATEVHKGFSPLWNVESMAKEDSARNQIRDYAMEDLSYKFDVIARKMKTQDYLMSSGFTIADAYLFTILSWSKYLEVPLNKWPALTKYLERIAARPATQRAMKAESMIA